MMKNYDILAVSPIDGGYIGNIECADRLSDLGIIPQLIDPDHTACSIGFSKERQQWFGWSHRGIKGFGVGHTVRKGNLGYIPVDTEEACDEVKKFWEASYTCNEYDFIENINVNLIITGAPYFEVELHHNEKAPDPNLKGKTRKFNHPLSYDFNRIGLGEWTAKDLDDAKQMAIDFAKSVA